MKDSAFTAETKEAIERLDQAAYRLLQVMDKTGEEISKEHAETIMRSQLNTIADVTEIASQNIGSGEIIDITDVSELEDDSSNLDDLWD